METYNPLAEPTVIYCLRDHRGNVATILIDAWDADILEASRGPEAVANFLQRQYDELVRIKMRKRKKTSPLAIFALVRKRASRSAMAFFSLGATDSHANPC